MSFFNFVSRRSAPAGIGNAAPLKRDDARSRAARFGFLVHNRLPKGADPLNDRLLQDIGLSRADYEALRG